jgi:hypothetical protein
MTRIIWDKRGAFYDNAARFGIGILLLSKLQDLCTEPSLCTHLHCRRACGPVFTVSWTSPTLAVSDAMGGWTNEADERLRTPSTFD